MTFLKPNCLCFDIGANQGQTSDKFVRYGAGHVISVEPCLENYLLLKDRPKTTAIMMACWSKPAILEVRYASNQPGLSSVQPVKWTKAYPDTQWGVPQPVAATTVDLLWEKYGEPFAIKIDVEGSENEVLMGLTHKAQFLFFEFHYKFFQDVLNALERCKALGYTKAHYVREDIDLETMPTTPIDIFGQRWLKDAPEWGNITLI